MHAHFIKYVCVSIDFFIVDTISPRQYYSGIILMYYFAYIVWREARAQTFEIDQPETFQTKAQITKEPMRFHL